MATFIESIIFFYLPMYCFKYIFINAIFFLLPWFIKSNIQIFLFTRVTIHLACPSTKQKRPDTINLKPIDQPENLRTLEK